MKKTLRTDRIHIYFKTTFASQPLSQSFSLKKQQNLHKILLQSYKGYIRSSTTNTMMQFYIKLQFKAQIYTL